MADQPPPKKRLKQALLRLSTK